jgi:general secretion pathway protein A
MGAPLVSTPDVVDLRDAGAGAINAFGEEPEPAAAPPAGQTDAAEPATLTYERYYGLREKAFSLSTDPRFLYRSGVHSPVMHDLAAAIRRREGLIVLTGEIGLGKTTLCRAVLSQLDRKTFATFVPDPFVTREDLLKTMLIDFGVMSVDDVVKGRLKGASRHELSYPLYEFLQALAPLEAFAVLVIDEVQNLSLPLLEEIRILSDLEAGGRKLLQVVLVGQPEFDEHLRLPRMRQIKQRVTVHCELGPLQRDGVAGYVAHRLQTAGSTPDQVRLTDEALDLVHAASSGVPRVINLLCDRALTHGQFARTSRIGPDLVRAALADLRMAVPVSAEAVAPAVATPAVKARAVATPPPAALAAVAPAAAAQKPSTPAPAPGPTPGSVLSALLDLPAVDLKVNFEEQPVRRSPRQSPRRLLSVDRGKVWNSLNGLRPVAATALITIGLTTGISLAGYWLLLRPLWAGPVVLPTVTRPAGIVTTLGSTSLQPSPPAQPLSQQPRVEAQAAGVPAPAPAGQWVIQTGVFASARRAENVVEQLTAIGYPAFHRQQTFISHGTLEVAFAGPYPTQAQADTERMTLRRVPGFEDAHVRELR